ncbi:hypothetical protein [Polynucleobacter sp. MWH-UH23A]|uniref:hypothetical protein n=1 Tax=Polynucleobacter sp. MWH-UH23A TaxID=1855613 RepID=UPI003364EB3D
MNKIIQKIMVATFGVALTSGVYAADMGRITILSPKNDAIVNARSVVKLSYKVALGPEGNHLHVYVDDQKPIVDRNVSGCPCTVDLPALSPGMHVVVVKEARADHSLTGVEASTIVTAK